LCARLQSATDCFIVVSVGMPRRLKVLMSAYACEPGKGSEPEVGWQWALQMARFHEVTVLTRANNREAIEAGLSQLRNRQPLPDFVYHDESPFALDVKRGARAHKLYYLLWQHSAREVVVSLHQARQFDLLHHVTFAAFRYPAAIWGHGVRTIWGPVGGIESIPLRLLPWSHPRSLVYEAARSLHNLIEASPFHILPRRAAATTLVLASTEDMRRVLAGHGLEAPLLPTIGLNTAEMPYRPRAAHTGPLRLLFVGNIITLKGLDLALHSLARASADATLTLVGDGDFLPAARRLTARLQLQNRVCFRGRLPRPEVLELYPDFDLFLFPSLHDTGGYAVIEAMFNELPVICLDCGGPALAVQAGCGLKVPLGSRAAVIHGLADAIRHYDENRSRVARDGGQARQAILGNYDWDRKGEQMNELYQKAAAADPVKPSGQTAYTGTGHAAKLLYRMISLKGLATGLLGLLLIGGLGFFSLSHLKTTAKGIVEDTLPGLSYAGQANAYLADAYRTLLIITTDDPKERLATRQTMEFLVKRTTDYLDRYQTSIFTEEDRDNFRTLQNLRKEFIATREEILKLADTGKKPEALALFHQSLIPKQAALKQAGEKLFEFNMREGRSRGQSIMNICTFTQVGVAAVLIVIFVLGFFIGLSK